MALVVWASAGVFVGSVNPAKGAEAGAWETFSTETNADAWAVYDFSDDTVYVPNWQGAPAGAEYIFSWHAGDEPLWFFADTISDVGDGAMVGDFTAEGIQGILVDVVIDSVVDFDQIDCSIGVRNSADEIEYYFSDSFYDEDFGGDGWYSLRFGFEQTWYQNNGTGWLPVDLTPEILADVVEIGFRFFPKAGITGPVFAAIDDVKLEPLVVAPVLDVSATATDFRMAFTPGKGNSCAIQKLEMSPSVAWDDVVGEGFITGPGEYVFTTPLEGRGIYRVQSFENYTPIVTTPPAP